MLPRSCVVFERITGAMISPEQLNTDQVPYWPRRVLKMVTMLTSSSTVLLLMKLHGTMVKIKLLRNARDLL